MTYDELTPDQKIQMQAFCDVFRPTMGAISKAFSAVSSLEDAWLIVGPIIATLDDQSVLGTSTGLSGAGSLTKNNLMDSMADFQAAMTSFYSASNRAAYIQAAGLAATL